MCVLYQRVLTHIEKQLIETKKYYLPLTKQYRTLYYEDESFFWQTRTIMNSILDEVERSIRVELEFKKIKLSKKII